MEKLFISDGAIKKMGIEYFKDMEYDDFNSIASYDETIKLDDGLLLDRDDMDNYSIHLDDLDDCSFEDVEDIKARI